MLHGHLKAGWPGHTAFKTTKKKCSHTKHTATIDEGAKKAGKIKLEKLCTHLYVRK